MSSGEKTTQDSEKDTPNYENVEEADNDEEKENSPDKSEVPNPTSSDSFAQLMARIKNLEKSNKDLEESMKKFMEKFQPKIGDILFTRRDPEDVKGYVLCNGQSISLPKYYYLRKLLQSYHAPDFRNRCLIGSKDEKMKNLEGNLYETHTGVGGTKARFFKGDWYAPAFQLRGFIFYGFENPKITLYEGGMAPNVQAFEKDLQKFIGEVANDKADDKVERLFVGNKPLGDYSFEELIQKQLPISVVSDPSRSPEHKLKILEWRQVDVQASNEKWICVQNVTVSYVL